ncbi:condensin complex subunit 2/barren [Tricharina praecox]|uniref:condensin complex subunit 2/barren n=1 Tax=Tricharina praecox TaxID=43433 RepID=UPI002220FF4A|nr:condensin complex subunit 2/barren [Tricharina praecox]KAI5857894.1 condensin complex subunit 2/barren [Tricharina praecox]
MARTKGTAVGREVSTPKRTTMIPLNDDSAEKAARTKERNLLQSAQRQKIKAAASPAVRRQTLGADGISPMTPRNVAQQETPKKVQILANFEEMMKMATDNKINATNSWDFALIDYFYDMSLLKEGDTVNFQKASCTLDGCVKIYTSRVDSIATETGKLLSGLAESSVSKRKGRGADEEGSDAEDGEEVDGEGKKKPRKKTQRSSEATLAKDFAQLAVKKLELEFSVDPLFKKATADRDEGGAKGLLLNNLFIDAHGRIVFDSSDDKDEEKDGEHEDDGEDDAVKEEEVLDKPAEILSKLGDLKSRFFPDLSILDKQDVCPSLKNFDLNTSEGLDIPFLKGLEDRDNGKQAADPENNEDDDEDVGARDDMAFGFDDGYGIGGDDDMTMAFGEGGEAWANETIADAADRLLSPSRRPLFGSGGADNDEGDFDPDGSRFIGFGGGHEDILSYFDERVGTNWAGPEHWRIRRIKDSSKPANTAPRPRKEKETFEINFMDPTADAPAEVLGPPKLPSSINMPRKDRISKSRNLLPDDKHFNSRQLIRMFLKPDASVLRRRKNNAGPGGMLPQNDEPPENLDEEFWAKENMAGEIQASSTPGPKGDYDANFFNDDRLDLPAGLEDDDDDAFADARESFSPGIDGAAATAGGAVPQSQNPFSTQALDFGSQLVAQARRIRPEYVQYARVAKKVDVRKLKENIWSGLKFAPGQDPDNSIRSEEPTPDPFEEPRKFTRVMNNLCAVYPEKVMSDISTSYCFICLLHLANEKGLIVEEEGGTLQELVIRKDPAANEADAY